MPEIKGINAVFFYVDDMRKVREFYEEILGFAAPVVDTPAWVEYAPKTGSHFALHAADPARLANVDRSGSPVKLSFEVDDLDAFAARCREHGVRIAAPPAEGHGFRFFELEDPEGNAIRLLQWVK